MARMGHGRLASASVVAALALEGGACTTMLYKGPARPDAEIAVLVSKDTMIDRVDDRIVRDDGTGSRARFEVLPGRHRVGISLNHVVPGFFWSTAQRSGYILVCVDLEAGHTYRTLASIDVDRWQPTVVDETAGRGVPIACDAPPSPVVVAPTAVAVGSAVATNQAEESDRRPGKGLGLLMGFAFGGSALATSESPSGNSGTISAGSGFLVGADAMATPLWAGRRVGFGGGVTLAVKYDELDASNGSASITRFPLVLSLHLLVNGGGGNGYLLLKGGVEKDLGVTFTAAGDAAVNAGLRGRWGPAGALGYYRRVNDTFAWDVEAFFAAMTYSSGQATLGANTGGLTFGVHLDF